MPLFFPFMLLRLAQSLSCIFDCLVYFLLDSIIKLETEFPWGFAESFGAPLLRSCDARRPSLHIIGPMQTGHQGGAFLGTELLRLPSIDKCCVGGGRDSRVPSKKQDSVLVSGEGFEATLGG